MLALTCHSGVTAAGSSSAFGTAMRGDREAAFDRRHRAGATAVGQAVGKRHRAVGGARDMHAARHRAGHERRELLVPHRPAVEMAGQMHGRDSSRPTPPAHRSRSSSCGRRASITSIACTPCPPWTCDTRAPVNTLTPSADEFAHRRLGARVDHRRDLDARSARVGGGAPAVVIVGEDARAACPASPRSG